MALLFISYIATVIASTLAYSDYLRRELQAKQELQVQQLEHGHPNYSPSSGLSQNVESEDEAGELHSAKWWFDTIRADLESFAEPAAEVDKDNAKGNSSDSTSVKKAPSKCDQLKIKGPNLETVIVKRSVISWQEVVKKWLGHDKYGTYVEAADKQKGEVKMDGVAKELIDEYEGDSKGQLDDAVKSWIMEGVEDHMSDIAEGVEAAGEVAGAVVKYTPFSVFTKLGLGLLRIAANRLKERHFGCGELSFKFCKSNSHNKFPKLLPEEFISPDMLLFHNVLMRTVTEADVNAYADYITKGDGSNIADNHQKMNAYHAKMGDGGTCNNPKSTPESFKNLFSAERQVKCIQRELAVQNDWNSFEEWLTANIPNKSVTSDERHGNTQREEAARKVLRGYHGCKQWTTMARFQMKFMEACLENLAELPSIKESTLEPWGWTNSFLDPTCDGEDNKLVCCCRQNGEKEEDCKSKDKPYSFQGFAWKATSGGKGDCCTLKEKSCSGGYTTEPPTSSGEENPKCFAKPSRQVRGCCCKNVGFPGVQAECEGRRAQNEDESTFVFHQGLSRRSPSQCCVKKRAGYCPTLSSYHTSDPEMCQADKKAKFHEALQAKASTALTCCCKSGVSRPDCRLSTRRTTKMWHPDQRGMCCALKEDGCPFFSFYKQADRSKCPTNAEAGYE